MGRFFTLVAAVFLSALSLHGQELTKAEIAKFKIKSIATLDSDDKLKEIHFFNEHGDPIKIGEKPEGQLVIKKKFVYDKSNLLAEEQTLDQRGLVHHSSRYFYNAKLQLIKKESKHLATVWDYEYDAEGNLTKETRKSNAQSNPSTTIYKYEGKLLKEEMTTDGTIGKEKLVEYKYNDMRKLLETKTKYFYFNTSVKTTYTYDQEGKLLQLDEKPSNGMSSRTTFQYNDKGHLISENWRALAGKSSTKTSYQIEY